MELLPEYWKLFYTYNTANYILGRLGWSYEGRITSLMLLLKNPGFLEISSQFMIISKNSKNV